MQRVKKDRPFSTALLYHVTEISPISREIVLPVALNYIKPKFLLLAKKKYIREIS
ncbi:hypothetical protein Hanom_Chr04g00376031 [Helianthus anomalus]